jgi:hypothetical protein
MNKLTMTVAMLAVAFLAAACPSRETAPAETPAGSPETATADPAAAFAEALERAHGKDAWGGKGALTARFSVTFGGQELVDGTLTMTPSMGRVRIDHEDGTVLLWDGSTAWVAPASSGFQGARFHVLTWPYFLAAPMKLRDPGSHLVAMGLRELHGTSHETARLTFDPGVGDSPDDWYLAYRDPATDRLAALAYIVTFGKSREEAEAEPHAITYGDYVTVDGVAVATTWQFWNWSEELGPHGDPLGEARLAEVRFVTPDEGTFAVPADARREDLPVTGG